MKRIVLFFFLIGTSLLVHGQGKSTPVEISEVTETVGMEKFYLHVVKKGQTLYSISKAYKVSLTEIHEENDFLMVEGLKPDQVLRIPYKKPEPKVAEVIKKDEPVAYIGDDNYVHHKVAKGETLYSLSKKYAVSEASIRTLNPVLSQGLKVGQVIKILPGNVPEGLVSKKEAQAIIAEEEKEENNEIVMERKRSKLQEGRKRRNLLEAARKLQSDTVELHPISDTAAYVLDTNNTFDGVIDVALFVPLILKEMEEKKEVIADDNEEEESEEEEEKKMSPKTRIALEFYEGVMLAAEDLKNKGYQINLHIYDEGSRDSLLLVQTLARPELKEMDLIVGPLYGYNFSPVANFAKENQITIVSPLSTQNKILFQNPFVSKVRSSSITQMKVAATFISEYYDTTNIVVVNNNNLNDLSMINAFKAELMADSTKQLAVKDFKYDLKDVAKIKADLSTQQCNVVILPSNDQSYVTDFLTKLSSMDREGYNIVLFGLSSWMNYRNLDYEYLNNLLTHIPYGFYVDYDRSAVKTFIMEYRKKYETEPSKYAYHAYDVMTYYCDAIMQFGSNASFYLPEFKSEGLQSSFDFILSKEGSGYENKALHMLQYKDYELIKAGPNAQ